MKFIDNLAEEAEQACKGGNMNKLYDTTKMLSGRYDHPERPVENKEGNQIIGEENQRKRWVEHFE